MSGNNNVEFMKIFVEFINSASEQLAHELVSPEAIFHVPGRPEPMVGPDGYLKIVGMMRGGFPDIQWTVEELISEGDKVAARFTMRGTHRGQFIGVPPTEKPITVQALKHLPSEERPDRQRIRRTRHARAVGSDRGFADLRTSSSQRISSPSWRAFRFQLQVPPSSRFLHHEIAITESIGHAVRKSGA